jgi:hypothetical protein
MLLLSTLSLILSSTIEFLLSFFLLLLSRKPQQQHYLIIALALSVLILHPSVLMIKSFSILPAVGTQLVRRKQSHYHHGLLRCFVTRGRIHNSYQITSLGHSVQASQIPFSSISDAAVATSEASGSSNSVALNTLLFSDRIVTRLDGLPRAEDDFMNSLHSEQSDFQNKYSAVEKIGVMDQAHILEPSKEDFNFLDLQARQLALEEDVHEQAVANYTKIALQLQSMGRGTGQRHIKAQLREWYGPFCKKLVEEINSIRRLERGVQRNVSRFSWCQISKCQLTFYHCNV